MEYETQKYEHAPWTAESNSQSYSRYSWFMAKRGIWPRNQEYLRRDVLTTFEAAKLVIRTIGFLSNRNSLLDKSATSKSRTPGRFEGTAVNNNWVGNCRRAWSVSMFRIQPCYTRISKVVKRLIVWISTPVLVGRSSWENGSGESLDKAFGSTSSRINRAIRLNSDHRFIRQQY